MELSADWVMMIKRMQEIGVTPVDMIGWSADCVQRSYDEARELAGDSDVDLTVYGFETRAEVGVFAEELGKVLDALNQLQWDLPE